MEIAKCDDRGRINLGKHLVERYGRRFAIVCALKEIILLPVPKDPVKDLQELGKQAGFDKISIKEIKQLVTRRALKEAMSNLERQGSHTQRGKKR